MNYPDARPPALPRDEFCRLETQSWRGVCKTAFFHEKTLSFQQSSTGVFRSGIFPSEPESREFEERPQGASTSNPATFRACLLNSTPIKW
ncbi:MAG: hypothetical protein LBR95_00760, partial [Azoarcus sp.]|nr:hypothetical protein [Azoarcus sp.]